jgi:hypothetical protein
MDRLARPFAVVGWLLTFIGAVGAIAVRLVDPAPIVTNTFGFTDAAMVGIVFLGLTFSSVGAILVIRLPPNAVGWCMVLGGAGYALSGLAGAVTFSAIADGAASATIAGVAAWLTVVFSSIGAIVLFIGFIFPTGRGHTPAWDRFVRFCAIAVPIVGLVLLLARPGPLFLFPTIDNPFGVGPDLRPVFGTGISAGVSSLVLVVGPLVAWSMASRYRRSDTVGRQQLKWVILAFLVTLIAISVTSAAAMVADGPLEAGLPLFGFSGALIPIAIGIAILRYRLYDIDRLISRTLSYAIVTVILGAVFGAMILALQAVFAEFTEGQTIAVAASTLAVFALIQPVLQRVRRTVDRRFDRARYDADLTAAAFADRLRDEVNMERVTADLVGSISTTLAPSRVDIWLRDGHR